MKRSLAGDLGLNLRDLGGLATTEGQLTSPGRMYRSGALASREEARPVIEALGLKTIIDLRTAHERQGGLVDVGGVTLSIPLLVTILPEWEAPTDRSTLATGRRYADMAEAGASALRSIFDLLSNPHRYPILVHCAAGRDRTGIVVATVLEMMGVPDAVIAADYARSPDPWRPAQNADPEVILVFLMILRERYGSIASFLDSIGVDSAIRETIRRRIV